VAAGSATISYTVTNANGCTYASTYTTTVNALPVIATINGANAVCAGSAIRLTDATTGGTWSSSDNTVATVDVSGNVTGVKAGTVTITYSVSNGTCSNSTTATITINPL